jgi:archaellum component FlaC
VHPIERALDALDANLEAFARLVEELPDDLQSALSELEQRERTAVEELRRLA